MRVSLAVLAIAVCAVACAAIAVGSSGAGEPIRLTPAAPVAEVPLGPAPDGPAILLLDIAAVRNPLLRPVSVRVALVDAKRRAAPIPVSTVSLFPSDQPGRFMLRAARVLEALKRATGEQRPVAIARLELAEPGPSGAEADGLMLEGIRVAWAPEPGHAEY